MPTATAPTTPEGHKGGTTGSVDNGEKGGSGMSLAERYTRLSITGAEPVTERKAKSEKEEKSVGSVDFLSQPDEDGYFFTVGPDSVKMWEVGSKNKEMMKLVGSFDKLPKGSAFSGACLVRRIHPSDPEPSDESESSTDDFVSEMRLTFCRKTKKAPLYELYVGVGSFILTLQFRPTEDLAERGCFSSKWICAVCISDGRQVVPNGMRGDSEAVEAGLGFLKSADDVDEDVLPAEDSEEDEDEINKMVFLEDDNLLVCSNDDGCLYFLEVQGFAEREDQEEGGKDEEGDRINAGESSSVMRIRGSLEAHGSICDFLAPIVSSEEGDTTFSSKKCRLLLSGGYDSSVSVTDVGKLVKRLETMKLKGGTEGCCKGSRMGNDEGDLADRVTEEGVLTGPIHGGALGRYISGLEGRDCLIKTGRSQIIKDKVPVQALWNLGSSSLQDSSSTSFNPPFVCCGDNHVAAYRNDGTDEKKGPTVKNGLLLGLGDGKVLVYKGLQVANKPSKEWFFEQKPAATINAAGSRIAAVCWVYSSEDEAWFVTADSSDGADAGFQGGLLKLWEMSSSKAREDESAVATDSNKGASSKAAGNSGTKKKKGAKQAARNKNKKKQLEKESQKAAEEGENPGWQVTMRAELRMKNPVNYVRLSHTDFGKEPGSSQEKAGLFELLVCDVSDDAAISRVVISGDLTDPSLKEVEMRQEGMRVSNHAVRHLDSRWG